MLNLINSLQLLCLVPILGGSVFSILTVGTVKRFFKRSPKKTNFKPPVSILKPVRGLEKNLKRNLRTIATQNYPDYQVIYSVQDPKDAAYPILKEIQAEFGSDRISVVISTIEAGANGKVNNLLGAIKEARHDIIIISDSDTNLQPDYIENIVNPLVNSDVGCVCTPFKVTKANTWYEKLELLTINADFMPSVMFAEVTGASNSCLGPSIAIRRSTLDELGGLESLADYLVEDYEIGRRVWTSGKKMVLLPYMIDVAVDLANWRNWWSHQVYWDQNTY
ncbi:ceramide glucosyltransferase, partial [Aphanothece sacrum]